MNLSGACGILVNVTAGPNLTMREFDEIGQVIHQFASEDATVVVGTALDMEMQDDVRVTVVATGLNRAAIRQPMRLEEMAVAAVNRPRIVARTGNGRCDGRLHPTAVDSQPGRSCGSGSAEGEARSGRAADRLSGYPGFFA